MRRLLSLPRGKGPGAFLSYPESNPNSQDAIDRLPSACLPTGLPAPFLSPRCTVRPPAFACLDPPACRALPTTCRRLNPTVHHGRASFVPQRPSPPRTSPSVLVPFPPAEATLCEHRSGSFARGNRTGASVTGVIMTSFQLLGSEGAGHSQERVRPENGHRGADRTMAACYGLKGIFRGFL